MFGYLLEVAVLGLGAPQAALGGAAGELSGKTVQPGPGAGPPPPPPPQLWPGGGGAVADCSAVSHGSKF